MRAKTENGIRVSVVVQSKDGGLGQTAYCFIAAAALTAGLCGQLCAALPALGGSAAVLLAVSCGACLAFTALFGAGLRRWTPGGVCVLLAVYAGLFFAPLTAGTCALGNDFLAWLTEKTGRIYLDLAGADVGKALYAAMPLGVLIGLLVSMAAWDGAVFYALLPLAVCAAGTGAGLLPADWYFGLAAAGTVLLMIRRTQKSSGGKSAGAGLLGALPLIVLAAALAAGCAALWGGPASESAQTLRDDIGETVHGALYDQTTNSMPEGRLSDLGPWNKSDTAALEITMDQPEKLYLRGFTGETYTGTAWEPLDGKTLAEYEDLFYWLHQDGFFGQSEIASAAVSIGSGQTAAMTVQNLSACSAQIYLPYALAGSELLDADVIGDARTTGSADTWQMLYLPGSLPEWYEYQVQLAKTQDESSQAEYLLLEQAYEKFIYDVYTEIPDQALPALNNALGTESKTMTLSEIRSEILSWLDDNMCYDESVYTLSGDEDFLTYVMQKSAAGYSVQYATVAVLMLRYYGVPARYVEGYYLSADEASGYAAGQDIVLDENHAHAWAEYYLDGVGWVPFEVTPGYIDENELMLGSDGGTGRSYQISKERIAKVVQPEEVQEEAGRKNTFRLPREALPLVLAALLLALAAVEIYRRRRLRRVLKNIDRQDNRQAIASWYGYAAALRRRSDAKGNPTGDETAAELNREALFSDHKMTDEQKKQAAAYTAAVLADCRTHWNFWRRLRYRWIECLY